MTHTRIVRECLHRFCEACIEKCLVQGRRKECPICRVHIPSRRSLAPDPDFDTLMQHIVRDNQVDHLANEPAAPPVRTPAWRILHRAIRQRLARENNNKQGDADEATTSSSSVESDDNEDDDEEMGDDRQAVATSDVRDAHALPGEEASTPTPAAPSLIKVVLIRLPKERTILEDLQMPFLTLSDDAPVSVLQQFLRQKYGFRFTNFDILLFYKNCRGVPITAPGTASLREFVATHSSSLILDNAAGYLPLHYRVARKEKEKFTKINL